MSDDELLELINKKDTDALDFLICKYKDLVNSKVNKYFIIGAEKEDIVQEGLIGLYKAIKDYKPDKQNSFKSFANLCIERQLITAIKSSNRQKHMPLNSYLSLNMTAFENEDGNNDTQIVDVLENTVIEDPLDTITKKEYFSSVERQGPGSAETTIKALSFVEGLTDKSLIADLGCGTGGQTITLAQHTPGQITGIDLFPDFINQFNSNAEHFNLQDRVKGIIGSMDELPFRNDA